MFSNSEIIDDSTVLDTCPKHSTIWAAMKRINSIPARPGTYSLKPEDMVP